VVNPDIMQDPPTYSDWMERVRANRQMHQQWIPHRYNTLGELKIWRLLWESIFQITLTKSSFVLENKCLTIVYWNQMFFLF
jgi:hypothetical protein